jgi:hypothetical protein
MFVLMFVSKRQEETNGGLDWLAGDPYFHVLVFV